MINPLISPSQPIGVTDDPSADMRRTAGLFGSVDLLPGQPGGEVPLLVLALLAVGVLVGMKYAGFRAMIAVGKG